MVATPSRIGGDHHLVLGLAAGCPIPTRKPSACSQLVLCQLTSSRSRRIGGFTSEHRSQARSGVRSMAWSASAATESGGDDCSWVGRVMQSCKLLQFDWNVKSGSSLSILETG